MRRLINDPRPGEEPLEILQKKISVFKEAQHAEIHANTGDQPRFARRSRFRFGNLPAQPEIHRGGGKEERGERRIPCAVKNIARGYEQILPRCPGPYRPIKKNDDGKKDEKRERIEQH